ncbi:tyrosine-type recombinase/integrase [Coraliomargarita parva]|uniref:tyrosine-type recombinase/integrase n=1 Tax=Coraliomargarita parva TaxID=3014050 RepID=UPI0022B2FF19|nr:tyrosine-type recombinase/integrase [Coraliomargarita parva]
MSDSTAATEEKNTPEYVRVAECLYRNTSSGRYYALVKRNGRQIRKSLKTQDRKLAERCLKEFLASIGRIDPSGESRQIRFEELGPQWLQVHNASLKPSSADRNERCYKQLLPYFKGSRISDIRRTDCQSWEVKRGKKLNSSTFNKEMEVLRGIFDYAIERGITLENPASILKRRKIQSKAILIPTHDEFEKLVSGISKLDERAKEAAHLVQLLAFSGMRLGEAINITWDEVDFDKDRFTVSGGEVGTKNHETRIVPLFPRLKEFLLKLKSANAEEERPRIIGIESAKKALISACKGQNLPHFTHHCLRHYFVSNAIEKGIDFKTIAAWVGHKDGGLLVAKTYGHLRDSHSFEMAKLMT